VWRRETGHEGKVTQLGKAYGEINLEALAAARPDLIVTNAYPVHPRRSSRSRCAARRWM
jgi:ABC-type Fe3+-hydroxamate transport system substrate-binding protein